MPSFDPVIQNKLRLKKIYATKSLRRKSVRRNSCFPDKQSKNKIIFSSNKETFLDQMMMEYEFMPNKETLKSKLNFKKISV